MSSVSYPSHLSADVRMLKEILLRAGFVSSEMTPLDSSDLMRSIEIIKNFRKGVIYPSFDRAGV